MANPSFPNISKPYYQHDITAEDPGMVSDMSDGGRVSRDKFTKSRLTFPYQWTAMSKNDFATLMNFYRNTVKGCSQIFTWTDPDPDSPFYNQTFNVRFKAGGLTGSKVGPGLFSIGVVFEEA
jgi:hypothetical protein